ncbi:hypothetical protein WKV44_07365 [Spirochaetia bacterium 38H-sp]|uniref:Outer membrane protein beta-barrel domain-containing protein n=1 Tax=Rarispira pelagica TaxID=3141764 RepID=A0ABU9UCH1_9SPIR
MRKLAIIFLLVFSCVFAFSQVRLDMGVDFPRGLGASVGGSTTISKESAEFFDKYWLPFPEAGIYFQFPDMPVKIGVGARFFTFILETIFWPNAFIEADIWRFSVLGQMGGGFFGMFGLANDFQSGKVFMPDLSLWFNITNNFRLGGGAMGLMVPELSDGMGFVYYLGAKFTVNLK